MERNDTTAGIDDASAVAAELGIELDASDAHDDRRRVRQGAAPTYDPVRELVDALGDE